jgi:hypothetical protein
MILFSLTFRRFSQTVLAACLFALFGATSVLADDNEPIAYIGHGGFFDSKGKQIEVTPEFVANAQEWYRAKLMSGLNAAKKREFGDFEKRLNEGVRAEGQARLVVQHRSLEWLAANSTELKDSGRTLGKLNALRHALNRKLPERAGTEPAGPREKFKIDPDLQNRLKRSDLNAARVRVLSATTNTGQDYITECNLAGVPIPPPIGQMDPQGLTGWKSQGFIPKNLQFIVGSPAEIRTYQSSSPAGMCIALPRYSDDTKTEVDLDGVICLGQTTSKVCFWDNQMLDPQTGLVTPFSFASGTLIPIGVADLSINPAGQYQAGGFDIAPGAGGICTDCHAGQNPYIVHPRAELEDVNGAATGVFMGDLNQPPLDLPTFSAARYDPLVAATWPQNQLSHSQALVPQVCKGCHQPGGSGGAFPHLSSELNGAYCNTILGQAITRSMPPSSPGSQANNQEVIDFKDVWCGTPASSGPSNRGDPHLTTTNGINYDFQAGGEFTALRNSATQFELQTRQTPVSTTVAPGANAYTGLASCVSLNTAAAVRVGKNRVTYQPGPGGLKDPGRLQLRIDGKLVNPPANGINLTNGNTIKAVAGGGLDIKVSDGTHLIISPNFWQSQGYWYLNVEVLNTPAREGTMGTILPSHWLPLAPNGSSFGAAPASLADRHTLLNRKFADAWRVKKTTSLFDYAPGTSTDDFTNREWPPEPGKACIAPKPAGQPAKPMKPEVAQRLCRAIKDKVVFENCVLDLTATGEASMLQAYLRTLKLRQDAINAGP